MLGKQKNWNGWQSARMANHNFSGAVAPRPFFLASQGVNSHPKPIRWWVYKTNENLKKEKVLLEISLEVPMSYGCLSFGCTWYDYDTAKSQQAKPAPSHQQRWFGTERCL